MRLSCRVPSELARAIERLRIERNASKSRVLKLLVDLAIAHPDYPTKGFDGSETVNCTIDLPAQSFDRFIDYRIRHMLVTKVAFLKDALERGASYYEDHRESIRLHGSRYE